MKQAPLALPVCPYCGQHFSYKEVMKSKGQEDVQCPKCKQNFKVTLETPFSILIAAVASPVKAAMPFSAVVIIVLLVNVCLYIFKPDINFLYMAGVMLVGIIAIIVMLPLVIRYVKPENVKYSTKTTRFKK